MIGITQEKQLKSFISIVVPNGMNSVNILMCQKSVENSLFQHSETVKARALEEKSKNCSKVSN